MLTVRRFPFIFQQPASVCDCCPCLAIQAMLATPTPFQLSDSKENLALVANSPNLRQRKPLKASLPPRASSTLGTDVSLGPSYWEQQNRKAVVPLERSHDTWVLASGYATPQQYQALLERCADFGTIVQTRGPCRPGRANWIAIQYETPLQATKAVANPVVQLSEDIFCSIQRWHEPAPSVPLFAVDSPKGATDAAILLPHREPLIPRRPNRSVCEQMTRWLLSIQD